MGDAITPFLEHPDPTMKNMCLLSKREVLAKAFEESRLPKRWKEGSEYGRKTILRYICQAMGSSQHFVRKQASRSAVLTQASLVICLFCLLADLGSAADSNLGGTPFSNDLGFERTLRPAYPDILTTNIARWGKANTLVLVTTHKF